MLYFLCLKSAFKIRNALNNMCSKLLKYIAIFLFNVREVNHTPYARRCMVVFTIFIHIMILVYMLDDAALLAQNPICVNHALVEVIAQ
jgi:hypothetical protein